ncbi:Cuticle protein 16.8 [Sarcoptes scabiei]|uniref:Cuticle protein 16.8 n=1 Tax=Sarcoptes scabiei TaxID=52283 RepID=A0A834RGI0_SARSC|nr:Cuticle protein 16.8 [Sarcoptes scabiei]
MFSKLLVVLACASLAYGQTFFQGGTRAIQLIPGGFVSGFQQPAFSTFTTAAAPQFFIGGSVPQANLQLIRQPAQQVQFIQAAQPQSLSVVAAAPQPQSLSVVAAAPQPQSLSVVAAAPQPQSLSVVAAAPQPQQVVVAAAAPKPAAIRLTAPTVEADFEEPGTPVAPYNFAFDETDEFGMNLKRQEASENGIVTGSYSFTTPEGYTRVVNYVSDEKGFRAQVQTNEPGTASSAPADAEYISSAPAQK